MDCAVTLFPEPLSPTSATISPSLIEKETCFTIACLLFSFSTANVTFSKDKSCPMFFSFRFCFTIFGSIASCKPSPIALNANIMSAIMIAGKNSCHHSPLNNVPSASFVIVPSLLLVIAP